MGPSVRMGRVLIFFNFFQEDPRSLSCTLNPHVLIASFTRGGLCLVP